MLNTGRRDYDATIKMSSQLLPGEPVFILKGHDPNAADTVRDYAQRAHDGGAHPALVESALQRADEMEAFDFKRAPDVGHLEEHEQKQLAYQLQRRAWASQAPRASEAVLLAEQRGAAAVASHLRPLLADLFANLTHDPQSGAYTYAPSVTANAVDGLAQLAAALNLGISEPPSR